ncbi:polyprenyl synthetase family protein [Galbibacter mesophilus]|uniref:polyprenyl synthetase family protein n=1 Tax=Galbibacter mesophilus TaxID=379069 RepID=UPI00191ED5B1|nr:polyprenyl synthetase family protein [Galbibacter mesophilus]MCM5662536.1 polyprenyl synthetase family protein [Galbibacter mesophilus]
MLSIAAYREAFISHLNQTIVTKEPTNLYEPIQYILNLGGKRLRPVLTLLTADIFGNNHKEAMHAAMAVEIFHNFSLVHDDIMDDAPLRRGKETVHEKWDLNTGILSGDAMLIVAYQFFENYEADTFKSLAKLFSKTAIEVCEGQQYDVDFETRDDVTIDEYLKMITYKTAVLVAAAMKMGAIIGKADKKECQKIYDFGLNLGIAFQLKDDYLDAFGDPKTFGKQVGGDIIENKKTYLYLKTMQNLSSEEAAQLKHLFEINPTDTTDKISSVKELMKSSGGANETLLAIEAYTAKALDLLEELNIDTSKKEILRNFANMLMGREV